MCITSWPTSTILLRISERHFKIVCFSIFLRLPLHIFRSSILPLGFLACPPNAFQFPSPYLNAFIIHIWIFYFAKCFCDLLVIFLFFFSNSARVFRHYLSSVILSLRFLFLLFAFWELLFSFFFPRKICTKKCHFSNKTITNITRSTSLT